MLIPSTADLLAVAPYIILAVGAGLILLIEAFMPPVRRYLSELTLIVVGGAIWARINLPLPGSVWADRVREFDASTSGQESLD